MRLLALLPRVSVSRKTDYSDRRRNYTELSARWGRFELCLTANACGVSLQLDERSTDRHFEWFLDKPTGEINCRVIYKKE
jgi:hypothetical protein